VSDVQIVKLPAHMRPASSFLNAPCLVDLLEPRVTICLQRALKLARVCLRVFPLAIRCVGEPLRWRSLKLRVCSLPEAVAIGIWCPNRAPGATRPRARGARCGVAPLKANATRRSRR
jgi:hypothetical protein